MVLELFVPSEIYSCSEVPEVTAQPTSVTTVCRENGGRFWTKPDVIAVVVPFKLNKVEVADCMIILPLVDVANTRSFEVVSNAICPALPSIGAVLFGTLKVPVTFKSDIVEEAVEKNPPVRPNIDDVEIP